MKTLKLGTTMRVVPPATRAAVTLAQLAEHDKTFTGYHPFTDDNHQPYGSFEVFYLDATKAREMDPYDQPRGAGFYWWSCFPGCLPDDEANGPFPTAEGAYLDAIGE